MREQVVIGLAQSPVVKGDVTENLKTHMAMIAQASELGCDIVAFPELSLSGYELELLNTLAVEPEAENFKGLSQAAMANNIIVIAGCPLSSKSSEKPAIGAVICFEDGEIEFYSKQFLHAGEENYCSTGTRDYVFNCKHHRIALAVCADFSAPEHSKNAAKAGADVYLVSALISQAGFEPDSKLFAQIAKTHHFPVLLSNHISVTGGWSSAGNNAVWDKTGQMLACTNTKTPSLLRCSILERDIRAIKADIKL
ncbi:carbon-nitrogen hydrolase family protein [Pseudoalteromonas byunsanensis]|uniref:carbon-nitrogen hydrolase family protein n=1 Tax=Pseudoalteromonas byunsanensis TaxID=327939 RepID=UPI000A86C6DE|nr:carbon-nitrogen hydrolase family protein [Pseudoalteromonas byunsanensis]